MVTAVMAPAHIRSTANPGTERGSPASSAAVRPMVRPWSPVWVVAAMATSSIRSGGSSGCRRTSSRMQLTTRSSARVSAYIDPGLAEGGTDAVDEDGIAELTLSVGGHGRILLTSN